MARLPITIPPNGHAPHLLAVHTTVASRVARRFARAARGAPLLLISLIVLPGCWYGPLPPDPYAAWPPVADDPFHPVGSLYYDPPPIGPAMPPIVRADVPEAAPAPPAASIPAAPSHADLGPHAGPAPNDHAERARRALRKTESRRIGPPLSAFQGYEPRILHWQPWNDEPPFLPVPTGPVFQDPPATVAASATADIAPERAAPAPARDRSAETDNAADQPLPLPSTPPQPNDNHNHHHHGQAPSGPSPDRVSHPSPNHPTNDAPQPERLPEMAPPEPDAPQPPRAIDTPSPQPAAPASPPDTTTTPPLADTANTSPPTGSGPGHDHLTSESPDTSPDHDHNRTNGAATIPSPEAIRPATPSNALPEPPAELDDTPQSSPQGVASGQAEETSPSPSVSGPSLSRSPTINEAKRPPSPSQASQRLTDRRVSRRRGPSSGWKPYRPGRRTHSPRLPIASRPPDEDS